MKEQEAVDFLEKEYKKDAEKFEGMNVPETIRTAIECLQSVNLNLF